MRITELEDEHCKSGNNSKNKKKGYSKREAWKEYFRSKLKINNQNRSEDSNGDKEFHTLRDKTCSIAGVTSSNVSNIDSDEPVHVAHEEELEQRHHSIRRWKNKKELVKETSAKNRNYLGDNSTKNSKESFYGQDSSFDSVCITPITHNLSTSKGFKLGESSDSELEESSCYSSQDQGQPYEVLQQRKSLRQFRDAIRTDRFGTLSSNPNFDMSTDYSFGLVYKNRNESGISVCSTTVDDSEDQNQEPLPNISQKRYQKSGNDINSIHEGTPDISNLTFSSNRYDWEGNSFIKRIELSVLNLLGINNSRIIESTSNFTSSNDDAYEVNAFSTPMNGQGCSSVLSTSTAVDNATENCSQYSKSYDDMNKTIDSSMYGQHAKIFI